MLLLGNWFEIMNKELIEFIEICLLDGVITEKEREVIFRKAKDLGIEADECEIILNGLTSKQNVFKASHNNPTEEMLHEVFRQDKVFLSEILSFFSSLSLMINTQTEEWLEEEFIKWISSADLFFESEGKVLLKNQVLSCFPDCISVNAWKENQDLDFPNLDKYNPIGVFLPNEVLICKEGFYQLHSSPVIHRIWGHTKGYKYSIGEMIDFSRQESIPKLFYFRLIREFHATHIHQLNSKKFKIPINFCDKGDFINGLYNSEFFDGIKKIQSNIQGCVDNFKVKLAGHIENNSLQNCLSNWTTVPFTEGVSKSNYLYSVVDWCVNELTKIAKLETAFSLLLYSVFIGDIKNAKTLEFEFNKTGFLQGFFEKNIEILLNEIMNKMELGFDDLSAQLVSLDNSILSSRDETKQQLSDLNNSQKFTNLLAVLQAYQLHKINKNTK